MGNSKNNLKVLFVTAEVWPFSKVGGLGDVAAALPASLAASGCDIRVVSPFYQCVEENFSTELEADNIDIYLRLSHHKGSVRKTTAGGVVNYFIENHHFFKREHIYNHFDDGDRFVFFCRCVLEMLRNMDWTPDIIHCNEWQTGLIPAILKTIYNEHPLYMDIKTVYTIHNLAYQGVFPSYYMDIAGLPDEVFHFSKAESFGSLNFMKAGITYADAVNTVSPRYAKEILTEEFGEQLDPHLLEHTRKLSGILNGLDCERYNPETDTLIYENFSAKKTAGKAKNKEALCAELGLELKKNSRVPLMGMVSRISSQKGFDLLLDEMDYIMKLDARLIVLGSGDRDTEESLKQAAEANPGRIAVLSGYEPEICARIYAASDIFLMPSRYEPCGLGQMIAMRYGAVPVARETGGIADTVKNFSEKTGKGNGVLFKSFSPVAFRRALKKAIDLYADKKTWDKIVKNALSTEFSIENSAKQYIKLYIAVIR